MRGSTLCSDAQGSEILLCRVVNDWGGRNNPAPIYYTVVIIEIFEYQIGAGLVLSVSSMGIFYAMAYDKLIAD